MKLLDRFFANHHHSSRRSSLKTANRRRTLMSIESLEGRQLLSTIPVTSLADNTGAGTLRSAIIQANVTSGTSTIDFDITTGGISLPNDGGDYYDIQLTSPLPTISSSVTINGTSEPGYNSVPLIEISGTALSSSAIGLQVTSSNVRVEGLSIVGFGGGGVQVSGSGATNSTFNNDWVGLDPAEDSVGNGSFGLEFTAGADGASIALSVISATTQGPGVLITGSTTTNVKLKGDDIGTTPDGSGVEANHGDGVQITAGASRNEIGETTSGLDNVISGNTGNGVEITGSSDNFVMQNIIGLDSSGSSTALPNGLSGVDIDGGSTLNVVGGTGSSSTRNLISGNQTFGVELTGSGTSNNVVEGNYIGTTKSGLSIVNEDGSPLGNVEDGVYVQSSANSNTIGGSSSAARNVISGNVLNGISLNGVDYTSVEGNFVGTDATGTVGLGTQQIGVIVHNSAAFNTIGGTSVGQRNVVSGNTNSGVAIGNSVGASDPGSDHNVVEGNYIGTNAAGSSAVANGWDGVIVEDGATLNTIGGTTAGARNVLSGNTNNGVALNDASSNLVEGNYIGTDQSGETDIPNVANGVALDNAATLNTIGGTTSGARNVISGNDGNGVSITNLGTTHNVVEGNFIGSDATGSNDLGNDGNGVYVDGYAISNTIGGSTASAGNYIAYNGGLGILFVNADNTEENNTFHDNMDGNVGEG